MPAPVAFTIRRVTNPSEKEIQDMTDALDESFEFKYFDHSLPSDRDRSYNMLKTHITAALADEGGEVYVAEDNVTKQVLGVATWHGPGSEFLSTEAQRQAGWYEMYGKLEKPYQEWWDYFLPLYGQYVEEALGEGTKHGGYHLQCLGVIPSHWRRGIGRALIEVGEEKAKAAKVSVVLETLTVVAVPFYARIGFEVKKPKLYHHASTPNLENVSLYAFVKKFN
ncbi:hypothetical protein EXIGLDRAFT_751069 [Exidia glandulosa HHB12029]|uniref:N-acetyltransferase domain-containing protein n=1 Tax=Exidia glandulosa HHB12029 TaxID=1314781 RepID=A0A165FVR0_EXIGL|nr:hypothetical protein EXIGLDRAFT_751069 [Exidia glandulosa HHB12029]